MENLLLVSEHTCGLDCKKFLYDFKNWDKADFVEARAEDVIGEEAMRPAGTLIHDYLINEELPCYTGGRLLGSYRASERSWEEQRDYIRRAVACLPADLRRKAEKAAFVLSPAQPTVSGTPCRAQEMEIAGYRFHIRPDGSLRLREKNGHPVEYTVLGTLRYATYSAKTARTAISRTTPISKPPASGRSPTSPSRVCNTPRPRGIRNMCSPCRPCGSRMTSSRPI